MEIRSVLVNVDLDLANASALKYAIDLARTFDAQLVGVAADQPNLKSAGMDQGGTAIEFYAMERAEVEVRLAAAETRFHELVLDGAKSAWRGFVANPVSALLDTAGVADIIVTSAHTGAVFQSPQKVNLGDLVLRAGRPVIDVADGVTEFKTDTIMVGWKDTREARRAVADALPFLQRAKDVLALTVSEGDARAERDSLKDLLTWLSGHGVKVRDELIDNREGFDDVLQTTAILNKADMLVTGGYGHSRAREWLFGGVTRNLLNANRLTRLLSN